MECKRSLSPNFEEACDCLSRSINTTSEDTCSFVISYPHDSSLTPTSLALVFSEPFLLLVAVGDQVMNSSGIRNSNALAISTSTNVSQHVGWLKVVYISLVLAEDYATRGQQRS